MKDTVKIGIAGALAGAANGLFGAGGGMILVPLLVTWGKLEEDEVFPASVSVIFPICLVSLTLGSGGSLPFGEALPYLLGGALGGIAAAITGNKIPVKWLHRFLGVLILWGGYRYLC